MKGTIVLRNGQDVLICWPRQCLLQLIVQQSEFCRGSRCRGRQNQGRQCMNYEFVMGAASTCCQNICLK